MREYTAIPTINVVASVIAESETMQITKVACAHPG
jgi:hypothetical protein